MNPKFLGFFGEEEVMEYTLGNTDNIIVKVMNYGAIITEIHTPDMNGKMGDVLLGYSSLAGYLQEGDPFMNAIIGRMSNRIADAKFMLNGEMVQLTANNGKNQLHGGVNGFNKKFWVVKNFIENEITFTYHSPDGEEGYPGNLEVDVTYKVSEEGELHIIYKATTDKTTPVNLTSHGYFNLAPGIDNDIKNHDLHISADEMSEYIEDMLVTDNFLQVEDTVYDFRKMKSIKEALEIGGLDTNFIVGEKTIAPKMVAKLRHDGTGRTMEVHTTEPGIQIYTSNWDNINLTDTKQDAVYPKHAGICLEAQLFPDSVNKPHFPSPFIDKDDEYYQHTIYKFGLK